MPSIPSMPSISSRRNDAVAYVSSNNPILLAFISAVHTQRPSHTTYCLPIYDSNSQRAHPRGEKMHERKLSRAKA